jgi:hypothetical protein
LDFRITFFNVWVSGFEGSFDKLKAENHKLKNALSDAHIRQVKAESFLEAACELFDIVLEEAKKFGK